MRRGGQRTDLFAAGCLAVGIALVGCSRTEPTAQTSPTAETPEASEAAPKAAKSRPELEVADATDVEAPSLDVPTAPEPLKPAPVFVPPAPLPASEAPLPLDRLPLAELWMPRVVLSEQHAAVSTIRVGDTFPSLELPDRDGKQHSLAELSGQKLTLIVFWNATQPTALEELSDLNRYFLPRFGDKGFTVVAVNSGDSVPEAAELARIAGAGYPVLHDTERKAFGRVATAKLPRSYLLDPAGKVLWFDIEYSPTTRRDLAVAIRHTLGE